MPKMLANYNYFMYIRIVKFFSLDIPLIIVCKLYKVIYPVCTNFSEFSPENSLPTQIPNNKLFYNENVHKKYENLNHKNGTTMMSFPLR